MSHKKETGLYELSRADNKIFKISSFGLGEKEIAIVTIVLLVWAFTSSIHTQ